jgi:thiol:disulfide interchange protein DsbC
MSLMSKLLITILVLSSFLRANEDLVIEFLQKGIGANPNILSLDINIVDKIPLDKPKNWKAYIIQLDGKAKGRNGTEQTISQRSIYFVSPDGIITPELFSLTTGKKLNSSISPEFNEKYYDEAHHLFGDIDAEHKVVIFSDPLCPFCRTFVPESLNYMKKYPKTYAVYYYHFPLRSLHPAAVTLVQAAIAAELQGRRNMVSGLYGVQIDGREPNTQKILDAFNKAQNTKIRVDDISTDRVKRHLEHDMKVAQEHLVNGTPTMFLDGKKDNSKLMYKKVKIVK